MVFINFGVQYPFIKNVLNNKYIRHAVYRRCKHVKYFSQNFSKRVKTPEINFVPFLENAKTRREEASRSILVEIQSEQCLLDLHTYCNQLGQVNKFMHCVKPCNLSHLVIVEFNDKFNVKEILSNAMVDKNCPVRSPFVIYKSNTNNTKKLKKSHLKRTEEILNNNENFQSVSEQMVTMYNAYKLADFDTRLRFLVGHQIESAVTGMFPNARAHLFGSSVNGYGKIGCDLDIVLRFLNDDEIRERNEFIALPKYEKKAQQRFYNEKRLEVMAGIFQQFLPGCKVTMRIPKARIPIIKLNHDFTNISCDISMGNMSGVHMSDLLYMYGSMDSRVRPLVFAIRHWAGQIGITQRIPGACITNFSLTLLVLAFLQNPTFSPPVLPPFNTLIKNSRDQDEFLTDGINCTFLRDIEELKFKTRNTENLETLLIQFFQFYASVFDFEKNTVNLNMGTLVSKQDSSPLHIVNPLEHNFNVAKNVNRTQLHKFKAETLKAVDYLSSSNKTYLFTSNRSKQKNRSLKFNVSTLFDKNVNKKSHVNFIN